jgi:hypothetical protein
MLVMLPTWEAEVRELGFKTSPGIVCETLAQNIQHQKDLVEWLKC